MTLWMYTGVSILLWAILAAMEYAVANRFAADDANKKNFIIVFSIKTLLVDVLIVSVLSSLYEKNMAVDLCRFLSVTIGTILVLAIIRKYLKVRYEKIFFVVSMADVWKFFSCYFAGTVVKLVTGIDGSINSFYDTAIPNMLRIAVVLIIAIATYLPMMRLSGYISQYKMRWPVIGKILTICYFAFIVAGSITPVAYYGMVILPEVTAGVIILAVMSNYTFHMENNRMNTMVEMMEHERNVMVEYCDTLDNQISLTKKLRHDLKNNAQIVLTLCEEENYEELKRFVESWKEVMDEVYIKHHSDFQVINATLSQKEKICNQLGIKLDIEMQGISLESVEEFDLTTILFNLMDNAINGCKAVDKEERFITLKCKNVYNQLLIIVKNSCNTSKPFKKLDDVEEHGIGLKIVNSIVNKYSGSINIEDSGNIYRVDINLNAQPKR